MTGRVTVELCDIDFEPIHRVGTGSFEGVTRNNERGQWRVEGHLGEVPPEKLKATETVVVRDARTILYVGERVAPAADSSVGGTMRTIAEGEGSRFSLEGVDCWCWLESRRVFPDPAVAEPPWTVEVDARSGFGSDVIEDLIVDHLGANAVRDPVTDLTVQNPTPVGGKGEWSFRLQPLSEAVRRVAFEANLVVHPTLKSLKDRTPLIRIREAVDRTTEVVLADIAELAGAEQRDVPPRSTWVLAAGSGEGASRMFRSAGGAATVPRRRIETVVEASNAQTSNELYQIAEARRREDGFAFYVSGRINEAAAEQFLYPYDYQIGDLISVQMQGERFPVPITAVTLSVTSDRAVHTPTLGTYQPDRLRGLRRDLLGVEQRFADNIS